jgi:16S rRNA (cytosine1402-N4)-methyltransferase
MTTFALTSARLSHRSSREEGVKAHEHKQAHKTHTPVLLTEAVHMLEPQKGDIVVDATFGKGGHSAALKKAAKIKLITIDADPASKADIEGNFADMDTLLKKEGVSEVNKVLFDLGWNMTQLGSGRGFSFLVDEPLNLSFGPTPRSGFTAAEILNTWSEKTIADVLFGYSEERYARRIAKLVVERRDVAPFATTFEFVELIKDAVPASYRHGRLHPATKSFQALRIAVNDELESLKKGLSAAWSMLAPGGRIAVITFHSIEDRIVKQTFAGLTKKGAGELLTKKPIAPTATEISKNPAARSAKLRGIQKL